MTTAKLPLPQRAPTGADPIPVLADVTQRIARRSRTARMAYLERVARARAEAAGRVRNAIGCSNLAHTLAPCAAQDAATLSAGTAPSIGIVTSYNDMLSAHQPFETYPEQIRAAARGVDAVARVAGGVPAMCDGITQGRTGMELSLFSRDVIAMSTAIALSHDVFDAAMLLGVCDKIVPGLVMGGLSFGHLPTIMIPSGPMSSGLPNAEKAAVRRQYAGGEVGRDVLLQAEMASYHSAGTCTFYGTANSNQLLMDVMGLHLPGAAFVSPDDPLRAALTTAATVRAVQLADGAEGPIGLGELVNARTIVNGIVALLATGGSTNHTMHLIAMAAAGGVLITWEDFDALSAVIPLLARIYPNGTADVNHFHAAGGTPFLVGTLLSAGLLHEDVHTVAGRGLSRYAHMPTLTRAGELTWVPAPRKSGDESVLRPASRPFAPDGGLRVLSGNLGHAVIKVSSVAPEHRVVQAPAAVFDTQEAFLAEFSTGSLHRDVVVVIKDQGPRANGMPELHSLTPSLASLQKRGHSVALVTDGRMSGASGAIPAAIHVTPEAASGGPLAKVRDGDMIRVDASAGRLAVLVDPVEFGHRPTLPSSVPVDAAWGVGRELFAGFRAMVGRADQGASAVIWPPPVPDPIHGPGVRELAARDLAVEDISDTELTGDELTGDDYLVAISLDVDAVPPPRVDDLAADESVLGSDELTAGGAR